jgi:ribosome-binding factor A
MAEIRLRKVESLLKEEISGLISRRVIKDPRLAPMTTITDVEVSRDLHYAKVYVSLYGDKEIREQSVDALNHASGFIHAKLKKNVRLRFIPKLTFFADDSIERGVRLTNKIRDLTGFER